MRKNILSGAVWVFAGKLLTGVAQILIAMVLTRMLSPEDFGGFQIIQRVLFFLAILGSFGMTWTIVRRIAEGLAHNMPMRSYLYAKNIFQIVLLMTLLFSIIFYAYGSQVVLVFLKIDISDLVLVMVGLIFSISFQQIIPEGFRGMHDIKMASIFSGTSTNMLLLLFLVLVHFCLEYSVTLSNVLHIYFYVTIIVLIVSSLMLTRRLMSMNTGNNSNHDARTILKNNLSSGLPLTLTSLLSFLVSQADIWIVAMLFSVQEAAYYAAASRLVFIISAPVMVANGATRGVIADLWSKGEKQVLQKLLRTVASLTVLAALIPGVVFIFWGEAVLGMLYGEFYQQAATILTFLVFGQMTLLVGGPAGTLMILSGYQKQVLYIDIISAALFFIFAYYLGTLIGNSGVAIASAIAIATKTILTTYFAWRFLGVSTFIGKVTPIWKEI